MLKKKKKSSPKSGCWAKLPSGLNRSSREELDDFGFLDDRGPGEEERPLDDVLLGKYDAMRTKPNIRLKPANNPDRWQVIY